MKFVSDCKAFSDAIAQLRRTCGNTEYLSLKVGTKVAHLSATNKTNVHVVKLEGIEIEEPGEINVPTSQLEGVLRNRKQLLFTMDKHAVFFESVEGRKYKGEITPLPYEPNDISVEGETTLAFTAEQVSALDDTVAVAKLDAAYDSQQLPLFIRMNKKGLTVVCGDNYHSAYIHNRGVKFEGSNVMVVFADAFNLISGAAKGKPYTLSINSNSIVAYNKSFRLMLPFLPTDSSDDSFALYYGLVEKIKEDNEGTRCTVVKSEFMTICENARAFYSQNVPLNIEVSKKGLDLYIATTAGSAKETIKATDIVNPRKEPFKLEMSILGEFLAHLPIDELPILTTGDGQLVMFHADHNDMERFYTCGTL